MDVLGVNYKVLKNTKRPSSSSSCKRRTGGGINNYKKGVKVVYISSPMMVKTSASKFRDLVQELTGKDSDTAARFMDQDFVVHHQNTSFPSDHGIRAVDVASSPSMIPNLMDSHSYEEVSPAPSSSTTTCSDSTFEPFDGFLEGSFMMNMLQSNLYFDASQLDLIT